MAMILTREPTELNQLFPRLRIMRSKFVGKKSESTYPSAHLCHRRVLRRPSNTAVWCLVENDKRTDNIYDGTRFFSVPTDIPVRFVSRPAPSCFPSNRAEAITARAYLPRYRGDGA